ncbi:hypothetical protein L1275_002782 [Flavobacterium sp. HSC-61S13]|nr:hypothetical protein [Flavobacterium sp. HSC-61S13]
MEQAFNLSASMPIFPFVHARIRLSAYQRIRESAF